MSSRFITIDGIKILLRKNHRARNIIISVKPFDGVRISIPERISFFYGEKLAQEKLGWIKDKLGKMLAYEKSFTIFNKETEFQTRKHRLEIKQSEKHKIHVSVKNELIKIDYPAGHDIHSADVQNAIRKGIETAYKNEAKEYLPQRIKELSVRHGLRYNQLFLKNIKSRWGSCSSRNNINLSIHLMRLPDHLIDYVLLHELAHTEVKNHSKKFWHFLNSLLGNAKELDKELKRYRINLY